MSTSKNDGHKHALSAVERMLSRNLGPELNGSAPAKVSKRRTAAFKRAKKLKEKRKEDIEAQLNPDDYKRSKLWERKRVAAAVTSWDSADAVDDLKAKVCEVQAPSVALLAILY